MHNERRLQPHEQLLFACANPVVDEASRQAVDAALAVPDIDWPAAVTASVRHGVAQHVAAHLRGFPDDPRVPTAVAAAFARMYDGNVHRNQAHFREVGRLVRALEAEGVQGLFLKGIALARTVYPDPALRNFADIDLLVERTSVETTCRVAHACGFVPIQADTGPHSHHERFERTDPEDILSATIAPEFDPSLSPDRWSPYRHVMVLEVHRGVFIDPAAYLRDVDLSPLRASPQTAVLPDGTRFQFLSWEAMLVHLADHASYHLFGRLIFPVDIAAILRTVGHTLDWTRVVDLAARYQVRDNVYRSLDLVRESFGGQVPDDVLDTLGCRTGRPLSRPAISLPGLFDAAGVNTTETILRRWLTTPNGVQRATALFRLLVPPRDTMYHLYGVTHPFLRALLHLWHPVRMMARLASALFGLLRRRISSRTL